MSLRIFVKCVYTGHEAAHGVPIFARLTATFSLPLHDTSIWLVVESVMKIVLNVCYGGFDLSDQACKELGISDVINIIHRPENAAVKNNGKWRCDADLVDVVERLGAAASDEFSELVVRDTPEHDNWCVIEDDGLDMIHLL